MSELEPKPAPDPDALPHPLTFFLSANQRRAVLRELKKRHADRTRALLGALGIERETHGGDQDG